MKSFFKNTKAVFITSACYYIEKIHGVKCKEHPVSAVISGIFLIMFVFFGLGVIGKVGGAVTGQYIIDGLNKLTNNTGSGNLATVNNHKDIISPKHIASEETRGCDLENGEWRIWLGNISKDFEDETHFFLPRDKNTGLFKYFGEIEDISKCEFIFVPRSDDAINYVISIDSVYQIVIGDNDYWTVSLRATDKIDGDYKAVEESRTRKTRPRLLSKLKKGTRVTVFVEQFFLQDGKYSVTARVNYKPDIEIDNAFEEESFTWEFNPSPLLGLSNIDLSIGLIRSEGDESNVGANFVYPNPSK